MRTLLHIGSEKTGSTSIQGTLEQSRAALAEDGVFVPRWSDAALGTHMLFPLIVDPHVKTVNAFHAFPGGYPAAREAAWEDWARIEDEIAQAQPHTLVLSSELLFCPLSDTSEPFLTRLKALSSQIDVVAYLRAPDSFALSSLAQGFKHNRIIRLSHLKAKLDFKAVLTSYDAPVADSVTAYDFGLCRRDYGSVVRHFFEKVLGRDMPDATVPLFWNVTPSPEALLVWQDFFSRFYDADSWGFTVDDHVLLAQITRIDNSVPPAPRKLTAPARRWLETINIDVDWLAHHHNITFDNPPFEISNEAAPFASDSVTLDDIFDRDAARQTALESALQSQAPALWAACGPSQKARAARLAIKLRRMAKLWRRRRNSLKG